MEQTTQISIEPFYYLQQVTNSASLQIMGFISGFGPFASSSGLNHLCLDTCSFFRDSRTLFGSIDG